MGTKVATKANRATRMVVFKPITIMNNEVITGCGVQTDVKQLLRLLGPAMYKGDTTSVAVKELLQNSFDACKKFDDAKIQIICNRDTNSITVIDNGIGMSSDTVKNVYLTIGGTDKSNLDVTERSGGLGLAKVQFFASAQRLVVRTVKDGFLTVLDCLQEELFEGNASLEVSLTDEPNGTSVSLYYPERVEALDGSISYVGVPYHTGMLPAICRLPLLGYENVQVTAQFPSRYNSEAESICVMPKRFNTMRSDIEFEWGTVQMYMDPESYDPSAHAKKAKVFSAGLFQFEQNFRRDYEDLQFDVYMDVRPKVAAGCAGYPINNTREGFNVSVAEDIKTISKYLFDIQSVLRSEQIKRSFENLGSLSYVGIDGTSYEKAVLEGARKDQGLSPEILMALMEAFSKLDREYEEKQIVKDSQISISKSTEETQAEKSEVLKYKNSTTGLYVEGHELFSRIASAMLDAIDMYPNELKGNKRCPTVVGIHIDHNIHGELLTGSMNAMFINPLGCSNPGHSEAWVQGMLHTFIHESAHIRQDYHYESFCTEMYKLTETFAANGLLVKLEGKLRAIYADLSADIVNLSTEFNRSSNV